MNFPSDPRDDVAGLLQSAAQGDAVAADELFSRFRPRLKKMIQLRLSRRLQGRVDDSDIIQEAMLDAYRKLPRYSEAPILPFYLWLRHLTGLKLAEVHRRHLGTKMRDASLEVAWRREWNPEADTISLAADLVGTLSSASNAAMRAEEQLLLKEALKAMDEVDREVIALKHFEQLTIDEISQVLGIPRSSTGRKYLKAMQQLKNCLGER